VPAGDWAVAALAQTWRQIVEGCPYVALRILPQAIAAAYMENFSHFIGGPG